MNISYCVLFSNKNTWSNSSAQKVLHHCSHQGCCCAKSCIAVGIHNASNVSTNESIISLFNDGECDGLHVHVYITYGLFSERINCNIKV